MNNAPNNFNLSSFNFFGYTKNPIIIGSGFSLGRTQVSGSVPYTGTVNDSIIACMYSTGISGIVVLPSDIFGTFVIKDESGTAGISNIRVSGFPNIDGASSFLMNTNYQSITIYKSPNGWRII